MKQALFDFLEKEVKSPHQKGLSTEIKNGYRDQKVLLLGFNCSAFLCCFQENAWHYDPLAVGATFSSPLQFINMDEHEVARQLTLIESDIYCSIKPKEMLDGKWNKAGKEESAPHILALIQHYNNVRPAAVEVLFFLILSFFVFPGDSLGDDGDCDADVGQAPGDPDREDRQHGRRMRPSSSGRSR